MAAYQPTAVNFRLFRRPKRVRRRESTGCREVWRAWLAYRFPRGSARGIVFALGDEKMKRA